MWTALVQPVLIAVLVVLEVAVWQVRVALATRGRKRSAAVLGAVNAVMSVVALGQVVTHLDRPANIAGYAVGVAVGVYLGVVADGRFAGDPVEYRVVLPGDGIGPAAELRARGWPVTTQPAVGSVVRRRCCSWWWTPAGRPRSSAISNSSRRTASAPAVACVRPPGCRCLPGTS
jgi:uncharacterized protein YebE (UPF0316 family)